MQYVITEAYAAISSLVKKEASLFFYAAELLHVYGLHHLLSVGDRGLLERLTAAEFLNNAGFFKLALEFFEGSFNVLAFFNLNDNHYYGLGIYGFF